jgi:aminoglycoside phosphotransferase family enzyme/predicted kinase
MKVERIDTHAAAVFLSGDRAYKLKRAVRFDYLDFSTPERRRQACEAEIRLNRRTAPALYRRLVAVTREPGDRLQIDGSGVPVDWLIEMERFDQEALLDRLAVAHRLDLELATALADAVAAFHLQAEPRTDHGGHAGIKWVIDGNAAGLTDYGRGLLDPAMCEGVVAAERRELDRQGALLESRRETGRVRQCHGDLHLGNIVLLAGKPTLFDAVEFNDEISCIDVFYDLAFLLMDLWHRDLRRHANAVLNRYLPMTGDVSGLALLPLYLSCRAAVRAKTGATAAQVQSDQAHRDELQNSAQQYLALASDMIRPTRPGLVAVGGFSGSGKSTLAQGLGPEVGAAPGAIVLRSDEIRKRLAGVSSLERLPAEGYAAAATERVYRALLDQSAAILRAGHSVIVDAVFATEALRADIQRVAAETGVLFVGFWLDAPEPTLVDRVASRQSDASDADAGVVRSQIARGAGAVNWVRLSASRGRDEVKEAALARLFPWPR